MGQAGRAADFGVRCYLTCCECLRILASMARQLTQGQRAAVRAAIVRRGELGLTQRQLAKAAGVSERTVSMFEREKVWPTTQTLAQLERLGLQWPVGYLAEHAARAAEQGPDDVSRDIADIMQSNLHPDLKLRLIDTLRQIRSDHSISSERSISPESDVG